jgi:uncharacterized protein YndB with AHSA1/START domain
MPTVRATRELLAAPEDVWRFLAEPYHLADWWPALGVVEPDRRGVASQARWRVTRRESSLFRKADAEDTLIITAVEAPSRLAFELVRARLRAELRLSPGGGGRTMAHLTVNGPLLFGFSGRLPKTALARLHDLCQTASAI